MLETLISEHITRFVLSYVTWDHGPIHAVLEALPKTLVELDITGISLSHCCQLLVIQLLSSGLQSLDWSDARTFTNADLAFFEAVSRYQLLHLSLNDRSFELLDAEAVFQYLAQSKIPFLSLRSCIDNGLAGIEHLPKSKIVWLDIAEASGSSYILRLTSDDLVSLSRGLQSSIRYLDMSCYDEVLDEDMPFSESCFQTFVQAVNTSQMETLDLASTLFRNSAALSKVLFQHLQSDSLKNLKLANCHIGDASLLHLSDLKQLENLNLIRCGLTADSIVPLIRKLPGSKDIPVSLSWSKALILIDVPITKVNKFWLSLLDASLSTNLTTAAVF
ncbi:hypothetical protein EDD86DRAFT_247449 [Gorgonomyces haynaldii]|nr:hypothetical protein EDD86DRAFT_247449 [Gorgonomyces haynaldii]